MPSGCTWSLREKSVDVPAVPGLFATIGATSEARLSSPAVRLAGVTDSRRGRSGSRFGVRGAFANTGLRCRRSRHLMVMIAPGRLGICSCGIRSGRYRTRGCVGKCHAGTTCRQRVFRPSTADAKHHHQTEEWWMFVPDLSVCRCYCVSYQ